VTPVLEMLGVSKNYGGLRPLRIESLKVLPGERVALVGLDQPSAETFVNLATGAALPDLGQASILGRATAAISDSADWLATVDRVGIVSDRAVLLDRFSVLQNLAMPFTLEIEPLPAEARARAEAIAHEVQLPAEIRDRAVGGLDGASRARVRLGRALALDPAILLLEHATAGVAPGDVVRFGEDVQAIVVRRSAALVAITIDERFARAVAGRVLSWQPVDGRLSERRGWFGRRLG